MPALASGQLARLCLALCEAAGLRGYWTWSAPTAKAEAALRAKGGTLPHDQHTALLCAWALWNGRGGMALAQATAHLEASVLATLGELLAALGNGSDAVESFLARHGARVPQVDVPPPARRAAGGEP